LKNVQSGQKRRELKVVDREGMVDKEIITVKKKTICPEVIGKMP
jgi:hypothetical protein